MEKQLIIKAIETSIDHGYDDEHVNEIWENISSITNPELKSEILSEVEGIILKDFGVYSNTESSMHIGRYVSLTISSTFSFISKKMKAENKALADDIRSSVLHVNKILEETKSLSPSLQIIKACFDNPKLKLDDDLQVIRTYFKATEQLEAGRNTKAQRKKAFKMG